MRRRNGDRVRYEEVDPITGIRVRTVEFGRRDLPYNLKTTAASKLPTF